MWFSTNTLLNGIVNPEKTVITGVGRFLTTVGGSVVQTWLLWFSPFRMNGFGVGGWPATGWLASCMDRWASDEWVGGCCCFHHAYIFILITIGGGHSRLH